MKPVARAYRSADAKATVWPGREVDAMSAVFFALATSTSGTSCWDCDRVLEAEFDCCQWLYTPQPISSARGIATYTA